MKRITVVALVAAMLSFPAAHAEDGIADKEWRGGLEALGPIGERVISRLSDPNDPQVRQETYKFLYSQIAQAYLNLLYNDIDRPDFLPYFSLAFNEAFPNPDDVYYVAPLEGTGIYRIRGVRGTTHIVDAQIASGELIPQGRGVFGPTLASHDLKDVKVKKDGSFEVMLSPSRPQGYKGEWWSLDAKATYIVVRQISYDWVHETDTRLSIERLDRPAIKVRQSAEQLDALIKRIPEWVDTWAKFSMDWVANVRKQGLVNKVRVNNYASSGGLASQSYIEGIFELESDEAMILETEIPKKCRYWNFQLADEMWASVDWVNRQSSINGFTARLDKDGKFRAVVSAKDPGVPNWLDNGGFKVGLVEGRWKECSSTPTPTLTKVKVAEVRKYLPGATPVVTPEARDEAVRMRRQAVQMRRKW